VHVPGLGEDLAAEEHAAAVGDDTAQAVNDAARHVGRRGGDPRRGIRIEVAQIGVVVRDDDVLGRDLRTLGDAEQLLVERGIVAREHRQVRLRAGHHLLARREAADLRAETRISASDLIRDTTRRDQAPHARGDADRHRGLS
jgi:hypothetical protein